MFKSDAASRPAAGDWSSRYLKFLIAARRKREDTQARYFYEWGNIHVSLMLTTPEVMETFLRYVQHYAISGIEDDMLLLPRSEMQWDNMADHWLRDEQGLITSVTATGYVERMQPHRFGDHAFHLALSRGTILFQKTGFRSGGGVKLIHWLKKPAGLPLQEFNRRWREDYAPAFLEAVGGERLIRKYVQNTQLELDAATFKGTLFEHGGVSEFAGVEEIWFDSLESLQRLKADARIRDATRAAWNGLIDPEGSFSMVTTERVVFDFVTPGETDPRPAILDPRSLEAKAIGQGYRDWHIPGPIRDA